MTENSGWGTMLSPSRPSRSRPFADSTLAARPAYSDSTIWAPIDNAARTSGLDSAARDRLSRRSGRTVVTDTNVQFSSVHIPDRVIQSRLCPRVLKFLDEILAQGTCS